MATVGYIRVSTSEQSESGLGLAAQESAIRARYDDVETIYEDRGCSGADSKRPGLMAAIEALRRGDILAVAKLDRLSRERFLSAWIEKECVRRGARVVSVAGEGTQDDDPASVLLRHIVDAFAQFERAQIGARTSAALQAKASRGEKTGGDTPIGYDVDEDGHLTPNVNEQEVIAIIRELKVRGYSLRQISAQLERDSVAVRGKTTWHPQTVSNILKKAA
jgi:site-specific DNA recombinase